MKSLHSDPWEQKRGESQELYIFNREAAKKKSKLNNIKTNKLTNNSLESKTKIYFQLLHFSPLPKEFPSLIFFFLLHEHEQSIGKY